MSKYPGNIITTGADTGYSVFFDGTGDYLNLTQSALNPNGTDYTVEGWFYAGAATATAAIIYEAGTGATGDLQIYLLQTGGNNQINFSVSGTGNTGVNYTINTWNYFACVKTGTTFYTYLNGVRTTSLASGTANSKTAIFIGARSGGTNTFTGYLSNLRVSNTAKYTGTTMLVPTQFLNETNTQLFTCSSPAIIDQSPNTFPITVNGNTAVSTFTPFAGYQAYNPALGAATPGVWTVSDALQAAATRQWNMYDPYFNQTTLKLSGTPVTNVPTWITDASTNNFAVTPFNDARAAGLSPFSLTTFPNSGSGYFDGTGDYLTVPSNTAFDFGSGDFCIEFFLYKINSTVSNILTKRPNFTTAGFPNIFVDASNKINIEFGGSPAVTLITTTAITLSSWVHVAIVRSGSASGNVKCYINGTADATTATLVSIATNTNALVVMGDTNNYYTTGYLSNLRLVKGVAVYTGNFTTPTAPLTATQPAGTNIAAITGTSTSLLTLQNSQSSNNNSFLDSSSNNFLITRSGNTTQGTFTPFSQTGWSMYFAGASGIAPYFSAPASLAFGTGDFTIEGFFYRTVSSAEQVLVDFRPTSVNGAYPTVYITTANQISYYTNTADQIIGGAVSANAWNHFAVSRVSGSTRLYLNGVQIGSTYTDSTNYLVGTSRPVIGERGFGSGAYFSGYLSNFRFLKGQGLYTGASITVPTSPLTAVANTSALCLNVNRYLAVDSSGASVTFNANTSPATVQAFSPFQTNVAYTPATIGGSGYFDGTGDSLSFPATTAALYPGSGQFTFELWFYTSVTALQTLFTYGSSSGNLRVFVQSGGVQIWNGVTTITGGNTALVKYGGWNHVVIQRDSSNNLTSYVNGTRDYFSSASVPNYNAGTLQIGPVDGGSAAFTGYISGFKFTASTAVYSGATITVPTAPPSASGSTACLLFTNGGIVDTTGKNVLETVSGARISTAISKFGGSSMLFNGTSDYLITPYVPLFDMWRGDSTTEGWFYFNSVANAPHLFMFAEPMQSGNRYNVLVYVSGAVARLWTSVGATGSGDRITGTTTLTTGQWYHIALTKAGTVFTLWVNGVSQGTSTTTVYPFGVNQRFSLGWQTDTGVAGDYFNGYMQDIRVARGIARYTGNFTPPTSLLQNQ